MCVISIHVPCFEWSVFFFFFLGGGGGGGFVFVFVFVFFQLIRQYMYMQYSLPQGGLICIHSGTEGMPILITESPLKLSQHLYTCSTNDCYASRLKYLFYTQWDGGYAYTSNRQPSEGCEPAVGQVSILFTVCMF